MTKEQLFDEIDRHLRQDEKPSIYLNTLLENKTFRMPPFTTLFELSKTKQSPMYHPEGNAWVHTLMVVDEAAKVRSYSKNPDNLMWASFLHDIGKPSTTAVRKGRITSYGHDEVGEELARDLLEEFMKDQQRIKEIVALVRYHMHILYVIKKLSFARIQQMKQETDIREVALLGWCDRMGRTGTNAEEEKKTIEQFYSICMSV